MYANVKRDKAVDARWLIHCFSLSHDTRLASPVKNGCWTFLRVEIYHQHVDTTYRWLEKYISEWTINVLEMLMNKCDAHYDDFDIAS